jgi:nicotinate dehydrogenase subunit A
LVVETRENLITPVAHVVLNHTPQTLSGASNRALLYALRYQACDASVRFGCGSEHCGACTVIVNGKPENACTLPLWAADQADVLTAQSLSTHPVGQHVLEAFLHEQAAQCGYCINGIMMRLTALFGQNPQADDATVREALSRHLCRCGSHVRILRAAKRAQRNLQAARPA